MDDAAETTPSALQPPAGTLFHRWFVEYNPLSLLSAALVLGGLTLVSRELARGTMGALGVAAIAELYALALIGGAAFLTKLELRRPAVMLWLLAVLFQGDLTLHVETCAFLGTVGRIASGVWLALFVVKLYALAAALELRPSRSAILVPTLGALGLAVLPHVFREVDPGVRTSLVALWIFAIGAAGLWTSRPVASAVGYDVRGRRAMRATWMVWGALALGHAVYWWSAFDIGLTALVPVAVLLGTRWVRREAALWAISAATLIAVGVLAPASMSLTALMVSAVLALHALRKETIAAPEPPAAFEQPYRGVVLVAPAPLPREASFERAPPSAMLRLLLGTASMLYVSLSTIDWTGGAWPEHRIALDVLLTLACGVAIWRSRRAVAVTPLVVTYAHLAIQLGWVPRGALQWGLASIGVGFALLACALAASWRWRIEANASVAPDP